MCLTLIISQEFLFFYIILLTKPRRALHISDFLTLILPGWFEWWSSADEALKSFIYVWDLDPGTTYQVRVVAKNGEGYETAAEWQELRTSGTGNDLTSNTKSDTITA